MDSLLKFGINEDPINAMILFLIQQVYLKHPGWTARRSRGIPPSPFIGWDCLDNSWIAIFLKYELWAVVLLVMKNMRLSSVNRTKMSG